MGAPMLPVVATDRQVIQQMVGYGCSTVAVSILMVPVSHIDPLLREPFIGAGRLVSVRGESWGKPGAGPTLLGVGRLLKRTVLGSRDRPVTAVGGQPGDGLATHAGVLQLSVIYSRAVVPVPVLVPHHQVGQHNDQGED